MSEKHKLCDLGKKKHLKENLKEYSRLVLNPNFICKKCGRVAVEKSISAKLFS